MIKPYEIDQLKTVCFADEDEDEARNDDLFYYVIDTYKEDDKTELYVVFAEKIEHFLASQGTDKELYYAEWLSLDDVKEIEI